jgi:hypothetical protein
MILTECTGARKLRTVLDQVVGHCHDSAIDPSLLALYGLVGRVRDRFEHEEPSRLLAAADDLNECGVWEQPSSGAEDDVLKAMFGCLTVGRGEREWALGRIRAAIALEPDAWDLRVCEAICLADRSHSDAAALLAPALATDGLSPAVRAALEAQVGVGVPGWFNPFL